MFFMDRSRSQVQALEEWREAERVVRGRWASFVQAEPVSRQFAFASYLAALYAEEAAAAELALTASAWAAPSADRVAA
jgi:hypothetical protein